MPVGDVLPDVPDEVEADAVPVPVGVLVTVGEMIVGVVVEEDEVHAETATGASSVRKGADLTVLQTLTGAIILARPNAFEAAFGVPAPHPEDGPHLAGFTIGCHGLSHLVL